MARPSPAALDVMEHIADAMDALDGVLHDDALSAPTDADTEAVRRRLSHAREVLREAQTLGAEVVLELLNLTERYALMQSEMDAIRDRLH